MTVQSDPPRSASWQGVALPLAIFFAVTAEMAPAGAVMHIAEAYGTDAATAALGSTTYAAATALFAVPLARRLQRYPLRVSFLVASLVFAAINLAVSLMPGLAGYLLLRGITGIAHGAFFPLALALAAQSDLQHPERAVARALLGNSAALALGVPLSEALADMAWQMPFILTSVGLAIAAYLVPEPSRTPHDPLPTDSVTSLIPVIFLGALFALVLTGHFAFYIVLAPRATEAGLPPVIALALYGICVVVGTLGSGWLGGAHRLLRSGSVLAIETLAILAVATTASPVVLAVAAAVTGVCFGVLPTLVQTEMMACSAGRATLASGVAVVAFNLGIAAGAALGGISDATFQNGALLSSSVLLGIGSLLFIRLGLGGSPIDSPKSQV